MTNSNGSDRLDKIESLLEETNRTLAQTNSALAETRQLTESNSRTIQAMLEQRATERLEHEQRMRREEARMQRQEEIIQRLSKVQEGLAQMLVGLDEDRPTILRKLNTIETKLDRLLREQ